MNAKPNIRQLNFFILFLIGASIGVTAQTFEEENTTVVEASLENQVSEENVTAILNGIGINTAPNPANTTLTGSSVFLQQIGDFNNAEISVRANASEIQVLQNGDANTTFLDYQVNTVITNVIQNGDGNVLTDFVTDPSQDISLDIQQQGNYLTFERFGSNELTRSLRFIQTEASPSIIVRSFN